MPAACGLHSDVMDYYPTGSPSPHKPFGVALVTVSLSQQWRSSKHTWILLSLILMEDEITSASHLPLWLPLERELQCILRLLWWECFITVTGGETETTADPLKGNSFTLKNMLEGVGVGKGCSWGRLSGWRCRNSGGLRGWRRYRNSGSVGVGEGVEVGKSLAVGRVEELGKWEPSFLFLSCISLVNMFFLLILKTCERLICFHLWPNGITHLFYKCLLYTRHSSGHS